MKHEKLASHSAARSAARKAKPPESGDTGKVIGLARSRVSGKLIDNVAALAFEIHRMSNQLGGKLLHLKGIHGVGEYILSTGPIVCTQDASQLYSRIKGLQKRISSIDFYEIVAKYLNISQIYVHGAGFLIENTGTK